MSTKKLFFKFRLLGEGLQTSTLLSSAPPLNRGLLPCVILT